MSLRWQLRACKMNKIHIALNWHQKKKKREEKAPLAIK